ncbi:hypothetical protein OH77DRAFT_1487729 [Trametes cingulata]|nr:hypothetical protein OH77DRAFT_1487729 [Trametes cingulata]
MESRGNAVLSYDILILVLAWIRDDYHSLFSCSLVNRIFKDASATYLYRKVTYSPAFSPVLDLKKRDDFLDGFFASARLPHNAPLVRRLEVSGYLPSRPPPLNKLPGHLKAAIECWPNIQTVILTPKQYHKDVFTEMLSSLLGLQYLRNLTVNASCTEEKHSSVLAQVRGLESLTIEAPTRAILQVLPDWTGQLESSLRTFRLTHSCGSVTPGVLRSFIPHLQSVTSFALGLSYSLTDSDVFAFWQELPCLLALEFRYYLQLRPSFDPRLPRLRHLTVHYSNVMTKDHTDRLCRWVRRVIAKSPLELLRLVCENEVDGPAVSFDPLVEHLCMKHHEKLRVLHMPDCFVGRRLLGVLCGTCKALEELALGISRDALDDVESLVTGLVRLHTVDLNIRNVRAPVRIRQDFAESLMRKGPSLRRLTVDGRRFEGAWTTMQDGKVQFVVEPVQKERRVFPWEKGTIEHKERTHHW